MTSSPKIDSMDPEGQLCALRLLNSVSKRVHASLDLTETLRVVAERMRRHLRAGDILARMGGDEFVAVIAGDDVAGTLRDTAERLRTVIAEPVHGRAGVHFVRASVGYAIGAATDDVSKLIVAADAEMYRVKHRRQRAQTVRLQPVRQ